VHEWMRTTCKKSCPLSFVQDEDRRKVMTHSHNFSSKQTRSIMQALSMVVFVEKKIADDLQYAFFMTMLGLVTFALMSGALVCRNMWTSLTFCRSSSAIAGLEIAVRGTLGFQEGKALVVKFKMNQVSKLTITGLR
jgi:hypothetical protein